jgi:arylamine N-acetyltransferase
LTSAPLDLGEVPADDILDALDLAPEGPSLAFLERLFHRFNARVPFETASKIVRNADVPDPAEKPRVPEVFWRDFLVSGTGGTCYPRVAAFDALVSRLGFATRKALGRVEKDFDHASLFVSLPEREWIADVGFPLPALLPAGGGEVETETATLSVSESGRGLSVRFLSGVPGGPRRLDIFRESVSEEEFLALWRKTFHPDSKFLKNVSLYRRDAHRVLTFSRGEARVDDLHSRTRIPLAVDRARRLAEIFGIAEEVLVRAFSIAGDPDPEIGDARITAYLSVEIEPRRAFQAIATAEGWRELMSGVADIVALQRTDAGWRARLAPPGVPDAGFEEEIALDSDRLALSIVRRYPDGAAASSGYRAESSEGETYLVREAILSGPREDLLKNDYARGRLAGTLAVDLLAWARLTGLGPE